jgi:hypothetical protein
LARLAGNRTPQRFHAERMEPLWRFLGLFALVLAEIATEKTGEHC